LYLGIVFNKSDKAGIAKWEKALNATISDGTYAAVLKKWGISDLALTPGVNLATKKPIS
ncbi:MAG: Amino acid transporter substrate-binding protein family, partial [Frondihabitans sp.]|nr:Amino acid transporter substrate-binding protein family [Frondihabitans sp.]